MDCTLSLQARPIKLAFLVDPYNKSQILKAIQLSSTLWGGFSFPIIPLYKKKPLQWNKAKLSGNFRSIPLGYIDAFEPDYLVKIAENIPTYIVNRKLQIIDCKDIWEEFLSGNSSTPNYGISLFDLLKHIYAEYFRYSMRFPRRIILPKAANHETLNWSALCGSTPKFIQDIVAEKFRDIMDIEYAPPSFTYLSKCMDDFTLGLHDLLSHELIIHEIFPSGGNSQVFIYNSSYYPDIIEFWNLRASGKKVIPIPLIKFTDRSALNYLTQELQEVLKKYGRQRNVIDFPLLTKSTSISPADYEQCVTVIEGIASSKKSQFPGLARKPYCSHIWKEWDRNYNSCRPYKVLSIDTSEVSAISDKNHSVRIPPLIPNVVDKSYYGYKPICANEVSVSYYNRKEFMAEVFPKVTGVNLHRTISGMNFIDEWRSKSNGLSFLVKDSHSIDWQIPKAEDVLISWYKDNGYEVELSTNGILAKQIQRMLGGFIPLIRDEKLLKLFDKLNGGRAKHNNQHENDRNLFDRDMDVGEFKKNLSTDPKLCDREYENLTRFNMIRIGLRVKCPNCFRSSWFPLESINKIMTCQLCLNTFHAIGNIESKKKSNWSIKSAGPFSIQDYAQGAYSVLLSIDFFKQLYLTSRHLTPMLSHEIMINKNKIEIDFAAFWSKDNLDYGNEARIMFGECKSYNCFDNRDLEKMKVLADLFPLSVIVLSTFRDRLESKEVSMIKDFVNKYKKKGDNGESLNPVLILTGNELFGSSGPPFCWEKSLQDKYSHIRSLEHLCEISQQIYLQMSSSIS